MKTQQDYEAFAADLKALCERHGVQIEATCDNEGINGEITLSELKGEMKMPAVELREWSQPPWFIIPFDR